MVHRIERVRLRAAFVSAVLAAACGCACAFAASTAPLAPVLAIPSTAAAAVGTSVDPIFASRFEQYVLTIDDYLAWCSVSVDGGVPTTTPPPAFFHDGSVIPLQAQPASVQFVWGYWTGTDGDHGTNDPSATTTVTMSSDKNVFACCPFSGQTTCP
jgi:hypothetical protein